MNSNHHPTFCPNCGRKDTAEPRLCPHCGESTVPQGYCTICERYWPLAEGECCPKHDVKLEPCRPRPSHELAPGEPLTWVTVGTFADALRAEAPRIRLEAEGIPTFVEGERMGGSSMYPVATGGVKLQVPEPLQTDARILLAQSWSHPLADDDLDDAWEELAPEPGDRHLAVSESMMVFAVTATGLFAVVMLIVAYLHKKGP